MSLSIIHLSDLHIKENDHYLIERVDRIVEAIKGNIEVENILILVSGDVAFSGKKNEYIIAKQFFDTLIMKLKTYEKAIQLFVVPGNHDIDFDGQPRSRSDVLKIRNNGYLKTDIESEISKFANFWNFVKDFSMDAFNDSKLVDTRAFLLGNRSININLINSAMFSLFKEEHADSDQGLHYLPYVEMQKIKRNPTALNICIMHHGVEYFSEEVKNRLCPILVQEADLVFYGHRHFISTNKTQSSQLDMALTFQGGKMNDSSLIESSFEVITCSEGFNEFETLNFHWNNAYHLYEATKGEVYKLCDYEVSKYFHNWLNSSGSGVIPNSYAEYYVFPRLRIKQENDFSSQQEKDILIFEDFNELIKDKKVVEVSGEDLSGKTTFLKYLYEKYKRQYRALIITSDDITVSTDKIIKNAFEKQYGENNAAFQKFLQLPPSDRIVLLDDIESVSAKSRRSLLQKLLEKFDKVIYTTNKTYDLDINKLVIDSIEEDTSVHVSLKIEPFYADKRNELIQNICKCLNEHYTEEEINSLVLQVNNFIKNQIKYFPLNPEFIIMFTRCYVSNYVDRSNTNAFNEVFSSNISASIEKARKKTQISDDLTILQEVANYAHFNKQYPISNQAFDNIVDAFNSKHRAFYNSVDVINELVDAKILKKEQTGIVFNNKSYLAYFVARWLNRQIHNGRGQQELKFIVDNICYNINADILLFLTYLTENVDALYVILNSSKEFSERIGEYDYDQEPLSILTDWARPQTLSLLSEKDKNQIKENQVNQERKFKEKEKIEKVNIYDENIDAIVAGQMKLLKYLEIISKILPNFSHLLDANQQDDFVEEIYRLPNRIIMYLFLPFENNKEQLLKEVEENIKNKNLENVYKSQEDVKYFLSSLFNAMMLTIYDVTAENAVTERTMAALESFNYKSKTTYFIQNILMHEQLGGFGQYVKQSDALYDKTKSPYIKHLLSLIFRKHCFYHDVKYLRDGQKYIDKYLPQTKGKSKSLIEQKIKGKQNDKK